MELKTALIVGVGPGLSASLARLFSKHGLQVAMAARNPDKLQKLAEETAGVTFACEATEPEEVAALFDVVIATQGVPDIVVYNASTAPAVRSPSSIPPRSRSADRRQRLRRLPGRAAGGAADGGARNGAIFLPAPRRASRATPTRRPSRWASSPCAAWRKAWPANFARKTSTSPISSSTAASRRAAIPGQPSAAMTACSPPKRSPRPTASRPPAPQRLDLGGRAAPLGREILRTK